MEFLNIQNTAGARFLPLARAQTQRLRAAGHADVTRNFKLQGFTITVKLHGDITWIRISGAPVAAYEFFVTEDLRKYVNGIGSAGHLKVPIENNSSATSNFTMGHGVGIDAKGRVAPLFSTLFDPEQLGIPDAPWLMRDFRMPDVTTSDSSFARRPGEFTTIYSWQDQRMASSYCWLSRDGKRMMTSAGGTGPGLGSNAAALSSRTTVRIGDIGTMSRRKGRSVYAATQSLMDEGYDIKGASYAADGIGLGATRGEPTESVWHRRCAEQVVELPNGQTRRYVIQTDTHGYFNVWPVDAYQSVDWFPELYAEGGGFWDVREHAKRVRPPYPEWVYTPGRTEDAKHEQMLWQWNSEGTRCVTVAVEREEAWAWVWWHPMAGERNSFMPMADATSARAFSTMAVGTFDVQDLDTTTSAPMRSADGSLLFPASAPTYQRVREWHRKTTEDLGVLGSSFAFEVSPGKLFCPAQPGAYGAMLGRDYRTWFEVGVDWGDVEDFTPAYTFLPGLLELGVRVVPGNDADADPMDFTVEFDVLQSVPYQESKRYWVDAAYYASPQRSGAKSADKEAALVRDDLLTAEVECFFTPGPPSTLTAAQFRVDSTAELGGGYFAHYVNPQHAQGGPYMEAPVFAPPWGPARAFHAHIDEPLLESRHTGHFRAAGVYAYYAVKKGEQAVQRICLAHDVRWEHGHLDLLTEALFFGHDQTLYHAANGRWIYGGPGMSFMPIASVSGPDSPNPLDPVRFEIGRRVNPARATHVSTNLMPASFVTTIAFADLRYLNFMTLTYQRAKAVPSGGLDTPAEYPTFSDVAPNRHLRVRGEPVCSVLYTADVPELGEDPAWNRTTPPETAQKLPSMPRGFAPCGNEGATLAMQQDFAAWSLATDVLYHVAAHPKGHWATCWNCTQRAILDGGEIDPDTDYTLKPALPASTHPGGWIDVIHVQGGKPTTHMAAFNDAFAAVFTAPERPPGDRAYMPRDYSYYGDEKRSVDELGEQGGPMNFGSFMSHGIFYDITPKGTTP